MAKSRLKTSSLALVLFIVFLVANVAITPVSAVGVSIGLSNSSPDSSSPTPQPPPQSTSPPPQPTPSQPKPTSQDPSPSQTPDTTDSQHQTPQQPTPTAAQSPNPSPAQSPQGTEVVQPTVISGDNNVVYTTLTSYSSFLPVPTSVPSGAIAANSNSGSSDSSSNVVIPAIVVGSVVVAAALGIWIFRKWKLSPSRDFKEKIQPIDFSPSAGREDSVFLRELNEP